MCPDWLTYWLADWLTDRLTDWLIDWLSALMLPPSGWAGGRVSRLAVLLTEKLSKVRIYQSMFCGCRAPSFHTLRASTPPSMWYMCLIPLTLDALYELCMSTPQRICILIAYCEQTTRPLLGAALRTITIMKTACVFVGNHLATRATRRDYCICYWEMPARINDDVHRKCLARQRQAIMPCV